MPIMNEDEWTARLQQVVNHQDQIEHFEWLITEPKPISTWEEFQQWLLPLGDTWYFRGQSNSTWQLSTSLDRKLSMDIETENGHHIGHLDTLKHQKTLLLNFQRAAQHYRHEEALPPLSGHIVDWLALMQHYGTPTYLLDWTRSPYIALFFALEGESSHNSTLWAIDWKWLSSLADEFLQKESTDFADPGASSHYDFIDQFVMRGRSSYFVVPVTPKAISARMAVQQGELLFSSGYHFSLALRTMLLNPKKASRQVISRVILKRTCRMECLKELQRMNISYTSLFPGLDGFAKSLGTELEIAVARELEERTRQAEQAEQDALSKIRRWE